MSSEEIGNWLTSTHASAFKASEGASSHNTLPVPTETGAIPTLVHDYEPV